MIHSSYFKPRVFPVKGDIASAEIDRAQSIDPTASLNREKVEEIGREDVVGYLKKSPTIGYRLTQYEYGNIEFWQKLVNTDVLGADGETGIVLSDFKTPYFDMCAYLTDDDGTYKGTLYYPNLRTSGFSFTIGDPQAIMERSFDFVGASMKDLKGDNKYFIYNRYTCGSGGDNEITFGTGADFEQVPVEDPNNAGEYFFKVVRVRGTTSTELTLTTDYSYTPDTLTIVSVEAGDVIKMFYSSGDAPDVQFTPNDSDAVALLGDSVSIYLYIPATGKPSSSDYIYRLQNVTVDVAFDREDIREIGNKDVVARGIKDSTVTVTLGRILEDFTIEQVLSGGDLDIIDVANLSDSITLIVKVFSDNTKGTFKYGFKATGLSPTELNVGASVNEYVNAGNTLEGENLTISADTTVIGL